MKRKSDPRSVITSLIALLLESTRPLPSYPQGVTEGIGEGAEIAQEAGLSAPRGPAANPA